MSAVNRAGRALWEFIVGDDWLTAAGVVVTIGFTAALAAVGLPAWWAMPVGVLLVLVVSLHRSG